MVCINPSPRTSVLRQTLKASILASVSIRQAPHRRLNVLSSKELQRRGCKSLEHEKRLYPEHSFFLLRVESGLEKLITGAYPG